MQSPRRAPASSNNFSAAFERMCNFVAISRTQSSEETLRELILQCFVILPDDKFSTASDIVKVIGVLFGLIISETDVALALEKLLGENALSKPFDTFYMIDQRVKTELDARLAAANLLELRVRTSWFAELEIGFPNLPQEKAWQALRGYLARLFRRHCIQAVAYLDISVDSPE